MAVSLELLTDDDILDYTKSDGKDNVLFDYRDFNLQCNVLRPYAGGVYDVNIFGSPMVDSCLCGKIRQPSNEPCPNCGARVYTREEGLRRFARIELPFYYLNDLRFDIFKDLFEDIFQDSEIKLDFFGDDLRRNGYGARGAKKLGLKVFDCCQFDYNPKKKELTISEFITDESKCSYEGLLKIISEYFPEREVEYKKLINRYYLVLPAMMRPFSFVFKNGKRKMGCHKLSVWYTIIIKLCCSAANNNNDLNYDEVISKFSTPGEKVRYTALLRAFLNLGKKEATTLLNTTKESIARDLYSVRTKNSARCPIVPDTKCAVDELSIPTHIAYEMYREGFVKHLMKELNFTEKEALKATREEANNPETMAMFKDYVEKQIVLSFILVR